MQYLVAIAIIVVFLAIWVGVDALSRKRGLTDPDKPRTTCHDCQCGGNDTCQIQDKKDSVS